MRCVARKHPRHHQAVAVGHAVNRQFDETQREVQPSAELQVFGYCFHSLPAATEGPKGCFLMAVNGVPVGWTDPHGASLDWISELPESEG